METWQKVPGFPEYSVSNLGQVRRDTSTKSGPPTPYVLKPRALAKGHLYVNLYGGGRAHSKYVHRLVLEAFVGQAPKDRPCAAHGDGNPANNRLKNLRWASYAENSADSILHGTSRRPGGTEHFRAKLNEETISKARALHAAGMSFRELGRRLGVSHTSVSKAVNGRSYKT